MRARKAVSSAVKPRLLVEHLESSAMTFFARSRSTGSFVFEIGFSITPRRICACAPSPVTSATRLEGS
jgi:hypothetical protein